MPLLAHGGGIIASRDRNRFTELCSSIAAKMNQKATGIMHTYRDVTLGSEIVDLVWLDLANQIGEVASVRKISVMQMEPRFSRR